jgi:hypothetical protein
MGCMNRSVYITPEDSSILAVGLGCLLLQLTAAVDRDHIGRMSGSTCYALPHDMATVVDQLRPLLIISIVKLHMWHMQRTRLSSTIIQMVNYV